MQMDIEVSGIDVEQFTIGLTQYLGSDPVLMAAAQGAADQVQEHFGQLDKTPNKIGGVRTHFWGEAAKSVNVIVGSGEATINISRVGVAQHYFGGPIVPVKAKFLTIPAIPEAHGKAAGEFDDLRVIMFGGEHANSSAGTSYDSKGVGALVDKDGNVVFWLRKKVVQKANPNVLPPFNKMKEAMVENMVKLIHRYKPPQKQKGPTNG